jgi:hypothetical protein
MTMHNQIQYHTVCIINTTPLKLESGHQHHSNGILKNPLFPDNKGNISLNRVDFYIRDSLSRLQIETFALGILGQGSRN